jgi:hypothetical protein
LAETETFIVQCGKWFSIWKSIFNVFKGQEILLMNRISSHKIAWTFVQVGLVFVNVMTNVCRTVHNTIYIPTEFPDMYFPIRHICWTRNYRSL